MQVETFFYGLKDVPSLPSRAAILSFRAAFASRLGDADRKVGLLASACGVLAVNPRLPRVIAAVKALIEDMSGVKGSNSTGSGAAAEAPSPAAAAAAPSGPTVRVTLTTLPTLKAVTDASGSRSLLQHVVAHLLEADADAAALGSDGEFASVASAVTGELDTLPPDVTTLARELKEAEAAAAALGLASDGSGDAAEALAADAPLRSFLAAARLRVDALQAAYTAAKAGYAAMMAGFGDEQACHKPDELLRAVQVDFFNEFTKVRAALTKKASAAAAAAAKKSVSAVPRSASGPGTPAAGGPSFRRF